MGSLARLAGSALAALVLHCGAGSTVSANELPARMDSQGLRIVGVQEVLDSYCTTDEDGVTWLRLPGGAMYELVTSTSDPSIANPGDGEFHPFDEATVRAALEQVRFPLDGLRATVMLLPFPRRGALDSGAGPGIVLLSPGVTPITAERQHAEFVHELGHVVQYQWMPDGDDRWTDYRRRRGIADDSRYTASANHADRPHEIFAEDFRALFGGTLATYSGSIENADLAHPAAVPGLDTFLRSLPGSAFDAPLRIAGAHPARGPVTFTRTGGSPALLELFDVSGRRIAAIVPWVAGETSLWIWNGRDGNGGRVERGVLLARVRGEAGVAARLVWIP